MNFLLQKETLADSVRQENDVLKIYGVVCERCSTFVFSRAHYDFRRCPCAAIAADGGFDYLRICYNPGIPYRYKQIELDVNKQQLYADWNYRHDQFGIIPLECMEFVE